jgi:hypothetical protein
MDKALEQHLHQMMKRLSAKCSEEIKASLENMEARAVARHERSLAFLDGLTSYGEGTTTWQTTQCSEEMEATNLEAMPEETEAPVERQELFEEEINFDTIGSSENRCEDQRLAVRRRRGAKKRPKTVLGPGRRCLLPASESYVAPSLQSEREIFARVQARITLQKKHLGERCL